MPAPDAARRSVGSLLRRLARQRLDRRTLARALTLIRGRSASMTGDPQLTNEPQTFQGHPVVDPELFVAPWFVAGQQYRVTMIQRLINEIAPKMQSCLQVGLGRGWTTAFGPNWVCVDLYDDSPGVHYHYDVAKLPPDWADRFDLVMCNAVLEHVPNPLECIAELHRVLKKGGLIWCEVPFAQPYHVTAQPSETRFYRMGGDYWRVSIQGMQVWMKAFETIRCDWAGEGAVFYFGKKPE